MEKPSVDAQVGPGSYDISGIEAISSLAEKAKLENELKKEMQRRLHETDKAAQKFRPANKKSGADIAILNQYQKQQLENPAPGQYNLSRNPVKSGDLSVDAQMKLALLSTFQVEKWHQ